MSAVPEVYARQGFGARLAPGQAPALVIVDFINGFADPAQFGGGNISEAIARTAPLLAVARRRGWPVAMTRQVFADDGADANIFSMKVPSLLTLTEASPASQIVTLLAPAAGELVVRKRLPSAFAGTGLAAWLVQKRVDMVVIAGCTTSGCIRATVLDAMNAGFPPFVVSDCCGDRAAGPHEANLFDIAQKYGEVLSLDALMATLDSAPAGDCS